MIRDAKVTARSPQITQDDAIGFAVRAFETDSSLSYNEKAITFANSVLSLDKRVHEIKAQKAVDPRAVVSTQKVAEEVLGKNASAKNVEVFQKLLVIAGV